MCGIWLGVFANYILGSGPAPAHLAQDRVYGNRFDPYRHLSQDNTSVSQVVRQGPRLGSGPKRQCFGEFALEKPAIGEQGFRIPVKSALGDTLQRGIQHA